MATVSFAGYTIWNDASTGVGPIEPDAEPKVTRWGLEPLLMGGYVAQDLGTEPGEVLVGLRYSVTDAEYSTLIGTIEGLRGLVGTLAVAPGQSYGSCILMRARTPRGRAQRLPNGSIEYEVFVQLLFQKLR